MHTAGVLFVCYAAARFPVVGMCGSSFVEGSEEKLEPCQSRFGNALVLDGVQAGTYGE